MPIRAISPNSTWLVTSRLDTFDVSSPCILVVAAAHYVIIISLLVSSRLELHLSRATESEPTRLFHFHLIVIFYSINVFVSSAHVLVVMDVLLAAIFS